jgi:hypothetical protein
LTPPNTSSPEAGDETFEHVPMYSVTHLPFEKHLHT